ncbi:MAG: Fibronectin type domain protein [Paenibacillaceae bacterium]|jgi:hypothetical protein|nr:Fibronectin type domain protein [Paenibacillaceae bacterium]
MGREVQSGSTPTIREVFGENGFANSNGITNPVIAEAIYHGRFMMLKKLIMCALSLVLAASAFAFAGSGTAIFTADAAMAAEAERAETLLKLDFEGANSPAAVLSNPDPAKLTVSGMVYGETGKSNAPGAAAAGTYARAAAAPGQNIGAVNLTLAQAVAASAKNKLNTLTPGTWNIKIDLDYDIVSRNDLRSPCILLRFYGTHAATGTTNTAYFLQNNVYLENSGAAVIGDKQFTHYSAVVPIRIYESVNAAHEDGNGKNDEFLAGSFTNFDFRIANFSTSAVNPMIIDWDNITVEAEKVISTTPTATPSAEYVGENRSTQGNWIGVYGSEGYILPFYEAQTGSGRDPVTPADMALLPPYVSGYTAHGAGYMVSGNPTTDIRSLQNPASGQPRKKIAVYSGTGFSYTFSLTDSNDHMFTLYSTDFGSAETISQRFEILDSAGHVIESRSLDRINNGVYVSFIVKGSFTLKGSKLSGNNVYAEGFFFDPVLPDTISNPAVVYTAPMSAHLSWSNSDPATHTSIWRKAAAESRFTEIAVADPLITSYTDTDILTGTAYQYKLRTAANYRYSPATAEMEITTPVYQAASLQFADNQLTAAKPGTELQLRATLLDHDGHPRSGQTVVFELEGPYVGTYIAPVIGTAITNAEGEAAVAFAPEFAGDYTIKGYSVRDDVNQIDTAQANIPLKVNREAWTKPPVIIRVSDAILPGALLSLNGYGLNSADMGQVEVKARLSEGPPPSLPPAGAFTLAIEPTDPENGYFVTARLPDSAAAGRYDLWVNNEYGWSSPIALNAARPLFISEYEAYAGLVIEMSGRNLEGAEFGAISPSAVRLVDGQGAAYPADLLELTPYSIKFTVPDIPLDEYGVEVSNDSAHWSRLDNGQKLTVTASGPDPLGLGVAWAGTFKWDAVFRATDYGAIPDDQLDDTAAIASAVAAAKSNGGGVVLLPQGSYYASKIGLPAEVILLGEGEENTILYYNGTDGSNFIESSGDGKTLGRQGVSRLAIRLGDSSYRPDAFIWLGHSWGNGYNSDMTKRTAAELFVDHVKLDYDLASPGLTGRGIGAIVLAKERFLFHNNDFKGWQAELDRVYVNDYVSMRRNTLEYSRGYVVTTAGYTFMENNHVIAHPESQQETHGLFARSNVHMANNLVEGTGPDSNLTNDGEAFCVEMPGGYFNEGSVLGATYDSIAVAPRKPLVDYVTNWRGLSIVITEGQGLGQARDVVGRENNRLQIGKPWDIVPDSTSRFTLVSLNDNVTFYRNIASNAAKGIWFYGNAMDGVAADNLSLDSEGIYVYSSQVVTGARHTPAYFVTVKGNIVQGVSRRSHTGAISVNSARTGNSGKYNAVSVLGVDIRDNLIIGDPSRTPQAKTEAPPYNGIVSTAVIYSSDTLSDGKAGDTTNLIIENNRLENVHNGGIVLTKANYGHVLKGNALTNVQPETDIYYLDGPGQRIATAAGGYTDNRGPFFPGRGLVSAAAVASGEVSLSWTPALDAAGVAGYNIYVNGSLAGTAAAGVHSFTASGLLPSTSYDFTVRAFDAAGHESMNPLRLSVTTPEQ